MTMPQPYKGRRVKMTIRLPYDVHEEAASRAAARRWNLSQYVGWCVERQINPIGVAAGERRDPDLEPTAAAMRSRRRRAAWRGDGG
ncbi:MAG TPA: hypothetical protein VFK70_00975 [Vicinamibacteria bacterium]|nr:hypothetical protein [Vicinamibacteria bacterium]